MDFCDDRDGIRVKRRKGNTNNYIVDHNLDDQVSMDAVLPEGCIAKILCLSTSTPAQVCRLSCVSTTFRSAAASDLVWDRFLTPGRYHHAVLSTAGIGSSCAEEGAGEAAAASSKKDLFFHLCHHSPILIDQGRKSFSVDKWSGKTTSYMIGPRDLKVSTGKGFHANWDFFPHSESRFKEVLRLMDLEVPLLSLHCKGNIRIRSPKQSPNFGVYLVYKTKTKDEEEFDLAGFDEKSAQVCLVIKSEQLGIKIKWGFLEPEMDKRNAHMSSSPPRNFIISAFSVNSTTWCGRSHPKERADGWLELEVGDFSFNANANVSMGVVHQRNGAIFNSGLKVQGFEIRPKPLVD